MCKGSNYQSRMNFTSYRELTNGSYLFLQKLNTASEELLLKVQLEPKELEKVNSFKLEMRKRQYLEARRIVQAHFNAQERIIYTAEGKPLLQNSNWAISLSHSGDYLAVIMAENFEVGIDLQQFTSKMPKITKRFIHEEEWAYINQEHEMDYCHYLWCAKEALFKWVEESGIHFKENLRVDSFVLSNKGQMKAHIFLENKNYSLTLAYEKLDNYYLVYTFYS